MAGTPGPASAIASPGLSLICTRRGRANPLQDLKGSDSVAAVPPDLSQHPLQLPLTCPSNRPRDCTRKVAQPTCSTGVGLPSSHLQMPS